MQIATILKPPHTAFGNQLQQAACYHSGVATHFDGLGGGPLSLQSLVVYCLYHGLRPSLSCRYRIFVHSSFILQGRQRHMAGAAAEAARVRGAALGAQLLGCSTSKRVCGQARVPLRHSPGVVNQTTSVTAVGVVAPCMQQASAGRQASRVVSTMWHGMVS